MAGCGSGRRTLSRSTLDATISRQLAAQYHRPAPGIDCPRDLDAKVGARESCVLTDRTNGTRLPLTVRVKTVGADHATYSISVGKKPLR